ncbi:MAG: hypothetical protein ABR543_04460 [Gemmatimonadaceae bacterium]
MRFWIGLVTLAGGVVVWLAARAEKSRVPPYLPSLGLGIAALGVSTLSMTRTGPGWIVSSIAFSLIAITLIGSVVLAILRRRS